MDSTTYSASIHAYLQYSTDDLLFLLVPEEERHSINSKLSRGINIYNQLLKRVKNSLRNITFENDKSVDAIFDIALVYAPIIAEKIGSPTIVPVLAILFARYGLKEITANKRDE